MGDVEKAIETQLANIEKRTGKTLTELCEILAASGLSRHGELRDLLKERLGMGHGDANTLVHHHLSRQAPQPASAPDVLGEIYVGPKAALRPIHEALMDQIRGFGEFEISPKKGYVSLRRKKQFAMLGPASQSRFELGLNMKGVAATERLVEQPPGGMCNYKVKLTSASEVDAEVIAWVKTAFDSAG